MQPIVTANLIHWLALAGIIVVLLLTAVITWHYLVYGPGSDSES